MPTQNQIKKIERALRAYRLKYLKNEFGKLDESATRIMVNNLLCDVLGYRELEEVKTEFRIRGEYADYVVQAGRKKRFVVEVKSIQLDISDRHLRQSLAYAANEGIDWIILLNGRQIQLYRVIFGKPISQFCVFSHDLADLTQIKAAAESLAHLTKPSVIRGDPDVLWKRQVALAPENIAKLLYTENAAALIRRELKRDSGIYFSIEDIEPSLRDALAEGIQADLRFRKK